jgi:hypothetical protein
MALRDDVEYRVASPVLAQVCLLGHLVAHRILLTLQELSHGTIARDALEQQNSVRPRAVDRRSRPTGNATGTKSPFAITVERGRRALPAAVSRLTGSPKRHQTDVAFRSSTAGQATIRPAGALRQGLSKHRAPGLRSRQPSTGTRGDEGGPTMQRGSRNHAPTAHVGPTCPRAWAPARASSATVAHGE